MRERLVPIVIPAIGAGLLVAWTTAGGSASPRAERPAPRCFLASTVNGFTPRGRDVVDVLVSPHRSYRLTLAGYCPDIDWSYRVALRTTGGGSWVCQGNDAELLVPGPTGAERCLVTDVRPLTPAEVAEARHRR